MVFRPPSTSRFFSFFTKLPYFFTMYRLFEKKPQCLRKSKFVTSTAAYIQCGAGVLGLGVI